MAAEILCSRWTVLVLRELLCGTTRFNDLRRGVPLMSPTLLSKRLKELIDAGVVKTTTTGRQGIVEYRLTEAGEDLRGIVMSLGIWGTAVDRVLAVAEEPGSVAADVGHAAEPCGGIVSQSQVHREIHLSRAESRERLMVDRGRRRHGRPLLR
jgi:DNA-binding HxlR family transcriptional regulator